MWVSQNMARRPAGGESAGMGVTTIGGGSASVLTQGEQRDLEVFAPGGVVWQPRAGDTVLVIKDGAEAGEQCIAAASTGGHAPKDMAPGELFLYAGGGASIYLRNDGTVEISGRLTVNGQPYRPSGA